MAPRGSAQRAAGQDVDADHARAHAPRVVQQAAVVLRRGAGGDRLPGGGVEHVVDDLRAAERAAVEHLFQRLGIADRGQAEEAQLAGVPQGPEAGHHVVQHLPHAEGLAAAGQGDGVVEGEDVDGFPPEPAQARLERRGDGGRGPAELRRLQPHLGADRHRAAAGLPQRAAQVGLRGPVAVARSGVEIGDSRLDRAGDGAVLVALRAAHHQAAHRPAPEPEHGDRDGVRAEIAHRHRHGCTRTAIACCSGVLDTLTRPPKASSSSVINATALAMENAAHSMLAVTVRLVGAR